MNVLLAAFKAGESGLLPVCDCTLCIQCDPTNIHIFGRPFKDSEALALAMAYQETAMFHSVTPTIPIPSDASKL